MEKEVEVNGKNYTIKEVKYKDVVKLSDMSQEVMAETLLTLSTGITKEEYEELSMKEGLELQKVVNEINGLEDFRKPLTKENLPN